MPLRISYHLYPVARAIPKSRPGELLRLELSVTKLRRRSDL